MRTSILLLFSCVYLANATVSYSQEKIISLKSASSTLKELCNEIEKKSDFRFIFSDDMSGKMNNVINIGVTESKVEDILNVISKKLHLGYNIYGKQIVVFDAPNTETTKKDTTAPQSPPPPKKEFTSLKGKVTDDKGEPLPGASIYVPATTVGVVSDIDGNFELQLPAGEEMIVCVDFVGMEHQELVFHGQAAVVDIVMKTDNNLLKELVVIGYGSKDRRSLTSSVSSMRSETVERLSTTSTSIDNLLGGNIKGLLSSQESGEPGASVSINVRGMTTMPGFGKTRNNMPLYVIDGTPIFMQANSLNPLLSLSPSDIESVDVLKDASATAIYGSRGANGVIIVKTKGGRKGDKVNVEAGYTFSMGNPIKEYKVLSTDEFKQLQDIKFRSTMHYLKQTGGTVPEHDYDPLFSSLGNFDVQREGQNYHIKNYLGLKQEGFGSANTNWLRAIRNKNAATHQYNVSVRGGSEFSNYSLSFNATDQEGLYINDRLKRYGGRLSIDTDISRAVKAGGALSLSYSNRKGAESHSSSTTVWRVRPDVPIRDKNGEFVRYDDLGTQGLREANPVAKRNLKSDYKNYQLSGNAYITVELMKGLSLRGDMNVASYMFDNYYFMPKSAMGAFSGERMMSNSSKSIERSTYTSVNLRADYSAQFGNHNVSAMLGTGVDRSINETVISIQGIDYSNEEVLSNLSAAKTFTNPTDALNRSGLNSVYSRVSYDYNSRYLAEVSLRADASSKFGPGNRVGVFPAISLGWRINNEAFMKDVEKVDDLKLRFSLGKTGSTNVEDFSYLQYFAKKENYGGELAFGLENRLPNQSIRWEMTSEMNGGIDFSFFNSRLRGSLDVYRRFTKGSLYDAPFVLESGMSKFTSNLIDLSNSGFELEIGGDVIRSKDFTWNSSFNISTNRNRVEKLNGANFESGMLNYIQEGQPLGIVKGHRVLKIIQEKDLAELNKLNKTAIEKGGINKETGEPYVEFYQNKDTGVGDYLYADINGDGRVTEGEDKTIIANPQPKFFGGWTNTLSYKDFSFSFLMQFSQGGTAVYRDMINDFSSLSGASSSRETFGRTWTVENPNVPYPRLVISRSGNFNSWVNDRFVFKTSYLRMKNITLSYNLGDKLLDALRLQNGTVFVSATNLFTLTRWPGVDPELLGSGIYGANDEESPYPFARSFLMGVRFSF